MEMRRYFTFQLHEEFLVKATVHCPKQTQNDSIPAPAAQAAVLTSVLFGAVSKQWRFLYQNFEITQNSLKNFQSLEICRVHKKLFGSE